MYGKNRVEADAKRLQAKEDELMKRKQEIRSRLTQLKKERRDLRTAVEAAAGRTNESAAWRIPGLSNLSTHSSAGSHLRSDKQNPPPPPPPLGKRAHASLLEQLKKVEEDCRQREEERVNLELELTEVMESLKKALSGGVTLGLTIEPKAGVSGVQVRTPGLCAGHECSNGP